MINSTGQVSALCFDPPHPTDQDAEYYIHSPRLYDEINCPECREMLGLPKETISRLRILQDNIAIRLQIFHTYVDADEYNKTNVHGAKINPDPDAFMAGEFLRLTAEFETMMQPLMDVMGDHTRKYGWADVIEEEDDQS